MMKPNIPESSLPRVVVVGAGFAGINVVKSLKKKPFQVVLINNTNYHLFQPLLYQVATGGLEASSIAFPIRGIFNHKDDFYFRLADVTQINPDKSEIETTIGSLSYDYLVLATGSTANYFGNKNFEERGKGMKSLYQATGLRNFGLRGLERALLLDNEADIKTSLNIVIVGGGPTGVELAGALAEFRKKIFPKDYPELSPDLMSIYLVEGSDQLLAHMSDHASGKTLKYLEKMGIQVKLNTIVKDYDGTTVFLSDGDTLETKYFIWSAGVKGNLVNGLPPEVISKGDRIKVNQHNQVQGSENIFAIGDVAEMIDLKDYPRGHPMLAPVGIQQGKLLGKNLQSMEKGESPKPFKYWDKGTMATIGRNKGVTDMGRLHFSGFLGWMMWMAVHLVLLMGFRNKVVVFFNWVYSYFTFERGTRIILKRHKD